MRYPERLAGGFSRVDGTVAFRVRVRALLLELTGPGAIVVDFGAGRGATAEQAAPIHRHLGDLRGSDREVIGIDVDPVVRTNPLLDRAIVWEPGQAIPIDDAVVGLVVSEWTFEHVDDAEQAAAELGRILRPGGWICACTPNKWGYIGVGARLVPNRLHVRALSRLQPGKPAVDTFPTRYRMNTRRALHRLFPADEYDVIVYAHDSEPEQYAGASKLLRGLIAAAHRLPEPLRGTWFVFIRRRDPMADGAPA